MECSVSICGWQGRVIHLTSGGFITREKTSLASLSYHRYKNKVDKIQNIKHKKDKIQNRQATVRGVADLSMMSCLRPKWPDLLAGDQGRIRMHWIFFKRGGRTFNLICVYRIYFASWEGFDVHCNRKGLLGRNWLPTFVSLVQLKIQYKCQL